MIKTGYFIVSLILLSKKKNKILLLNQNGSWGVPNTVIGHDEDEINAIGRLIKCMLSRGIKVSSAPEPKKIITMGNNIVVPYQGKLIDDEINYFLDFNEATLYGRDQKYFMTQPMTKVVHSFI